MLRDVATTEQLRDFDRRWEAVRVNRILFDYFGGRTRPAGRRGPLFGEASLSSRQYQRRHAKHILVNGLRAIAMNLPFERDTPRNARLRDLFEECVEAARFRKRIAVIQRLKEALPIMPFPPYLKKQFRYL